jgi:hypothetical protein
MRHREEFGVVGEFGVERIQRVHHTFERFLLAAQFLGALGVVPDRRVFQRCVDVL